MARLPLEGIRVLDLTVVWAGPYCTMLLGDLGAEVIRLDNPYLFPSSTKGFAARVTKEMAEALGPIVGAFPDRDPGERPWNRHAMFNCHNRGRRMATVDLSKESGRDAVLRLVDAADVLVENNAARVLDKLGLGWDVLHDRNPRFILLRMPPMGLSGAYHDFVGFGAHFEAVSGLTAVRGYHDADLTSSTSVFHMDPASGAAGAFAVMAALRRRARTGEGALIELPQAENVMQQIGELFVDAARTGRQHEPLGNRHPTRAPQGCYRCAGEDRWVVISVGSDDEWAGLRRAMGDPGWAADGRYATLEGRRDAHDELDGRITSWTSTLDPDDAFHRCQAEGVPAGPVMTEADAFADPHLRARGFFRANTGAETGTHEYPAHPWHWTGPELAWGPIAGMGHDNEYVWREVAGLSPDEYDELDAEGHLSLDYLGPDGKPL
ncbi:MAG TPA: CoA transferase [Acidimicrobiales bacterium]|nr:CoA transferase [Acidimicrobiales bacterium]